MQEPDAPGYTQKTELADDARQFLQAHETTVLSTKDRNGEVSGVVVYYTLRDDCIYILTKSDTAKAHNMMTNPQVALTMFDEPELKTAQIKGYAQIEGDTQTKQDIFDKLVRPRNYGHDELMPPITELSAGGFIAFRITPTEVKFTDYKATERLA